MDRKKIISECDLTGEKSNNGYVTKIVIVIPSLQPGNNLFQVLDNLHICLSKQENSSIQARILIVDDGSGADYLHIFERIEEQYNCKVLRHAVNLGKGRALKTAFNYFLNEYSDYHGIVTADSDGQHTAEDIVNCIKSFSEDNAFILGCRDFNSKNVPKTNQLGNKITRCIFNFLCGVKVTDSQTGLRIIPTELVKSMITIPGERFEYEMNMLVECGNKKIKIKEVPIETVYLDNNKGSHFNIVLDSIRIYKTFIKYLLSALSSFLLDIALFAIIVFVTKEFFLSYILISTVAARIISSFYNYMVNKNIVFASDKGRNTLVKYYVLAVCIMGLSAVFTTLLFNLSFFNEVSSKVLVDTVLFLMSYYVQRKWIF